MRDNWNIEEFTDQAWSKMREALDREMPVHIPGRKPAAFWWWLAASIMIAIAASWLYWPVSAPRAGTDDLSVVASPSLEGTGPEAAAVEEIPPELNAAAASEPEASLQAENSSNSARADAAAPNSTPVEKSGMPVKEVENALNINSKKDLNESNPFTLIDTEEIEAVGPETPLDPEKEAWAKPEEVTPSPEWAEQLPALVFEPVPGLPFSPLELPEISPENSSGYKPKKQLFDPLEISGGPVSWNVSGINGFFTELRSGIKLSAGGKWSLQSGIGMHYQQQPFSIDYRNKSIALESKADAVDQNTGSPVSGQNSVPVTIPELVASSDIRISSLYVDLPVLLQWRAAPKWAFEAGVRMSWLQSFSWRNANQNPPGSFGNNASYALDFSNSSRLISFYRQGGNQAPTVFSLKDFYAAGTAGLTFRLSPQWFLRLQYQQSFTNLLDSDKYKSTDRSLWLGTGLRF